MSIWNCTYCIKGVGQNTKNTIEVIEGDDQVTCKNCKRSFKVIRDEEHPNFFYFEEIH